MNLKRVNKISDAADLYQSADTSFKNAVKQIEETMGTDGETVETHADFDVNGHKVKLYASHESGGKYYWGIHVDGDVVCDGEADDAVHFASNLKDQSKCETCTGDLLASLGLSQSITDGIIGKLFSKGKPSKELVEKFQNFVDNAVKVVAGTKTRGEQVNLAIKVTFPTEFKIGDQQMKLKKAKKDGDGVFLITYAPEGEYSKAELSDYEL